MPRLPGPEAVGSLPAMRPGGTPPQISDSNPIAAGIGRIGQGMVALSNEQRERDDAIQVAEADAHLTTRLADARRQFETDPDYETFGPRFQAEAERIRAEASSIIRRPELLRRWNPRADTTIAGSLDTVLGRGRGLRAEAEYDRLDRVLGDLGTQYVRAADDDTRSTLMRSIEDSIELGRRTGIVSPGRLRELRQRHLHGVVEADADARLLAGDGFAALLELREGDARATAPSTGQVSELGVSNIQRLMRRISPPPQGQTPAQAQAELRRLRTEAGRISQWMGSNLVGEDGQPISLTQLQHDALVGYALSRRGGTPQDALTELLPSIQSGNWESVASAVRAGGLTALEQPAPAAATAPGVPTSLGSVSARYESGGRGVGFISSGRGDPGGPSYGIHQLSGVSSMGAFLDSPEGTRYRGEFGSARPMSPEFNAIYRQIAERDPEGFAAAQHAFYTRTHYEPARAAAEAAGFDVSSRAIQEALFSIGVQHGGAQTVIARAAERMGANAGIEDQIRALYEARSDYVRGLSTLPEATRQSVLSRYQREVQDILQLARSGAPPAMPGGPPLARSPGDDEIGDMIVGRAPSSRYAGLPFDRRQVVIRRLSEGLRTEAAEQANLDIASIRQTGEPRRLPDGSSWLDRVPHVMTRMQADRIARLAREARAQFEAIRGLSEATPEQMAERLDSISSIGASEDGTTPNTRPFVARVVQGITELRESDPALWASGAFIAGQSGSVRTGADGQLHAVPAQEDLRIQPAEEVTRAYQLLARRYASTGLRVVDGELVIADPTSPTGQARPQRLLLTDERLTPEDRRLIIEARVAAMARVGIPEQGRRILRRDEAAALLGLPPRLQGVSPDDMDRHLRAAADRATALFGPQYARAAFETAVHLRGLAGENLRRAESAAYRLQGRAMEALDREEALWRGGGPVVGHLYSGWQLPGATSFFGGEQPSEFTALGRQTLPGAFSMAPPGSDLGPMAGIPGYGSVQAGSGAAPYVASSTVPRQTRATGVPGVSAQEWPRPTPEDIQDLVADPRTFQQRFDAEFGPGAAAAYLQMSRRGR